MAFYDFERTKWNPTKEQYIQYKKRELELAVQQITKSGKLFILRSESLFSEKTIEEAMFQAGKRIIANLTAAQ